MNWILRLTNLRRQPARHLSSSQAKPKDSEQNGQSDQPTVKPTVDKPQFKYLVESVGLDYI